MTKHNVTGRTFEGQVLLHCITQVALGMSSQLGLGDRVKEVFGLAPGATEADVVLTVNGVEVPFSSFIAHLESEIPRMVHARAQTLVQERMLDFGNRLYDLEENIKEAAKKRFPELSFEEED